MKRFALGLTLVTLIATAAASQQPPDSRRPLTQPGQLGQPGPGPGNPDPISQLLFPPELIMQHQSELALTDAQRDAIQKAIVAAQAKFLEIQWKMSSESEKLQRILSSTPIDENQATEQLDRILTAERDVKKAQIGLLVRIKNTLTRDQQAKLEQLRRPSCDLRVLRPDHPACRTEDESSDVSRGRR